jgi:uncharacterized membrane protein
MTTKAKAFKRTFITGLVIIIPILVTLWIIMFIFNLASGSITPLILKVLEFVTGGTWVEHVWIEWVAPLVSFVLAVVFIYVLGLIGGNVIGRHLIDWMSQLLLQIPFVRGIYSAARQFVGSFSGDRRAFSEVVLVEYPRSGVWTLGLVTGPTRGEIQSVLPGEWLNVFVPTTPNPTSGWILFIPVTQVIRLRMSVDDALKMIISAGVLTPELPPSARRT